MECHRYDKQNAYLAIIHLIYVSQIEEGWAEGSCNGKRGLFPTNFVELLPESSESEESPDVGIEPKLDDSNYDDVAATSSQKKANSH